MTIISIYKAGQNENAHVLVVLNSYGFLDCFMVGNLEIIHNVNAGKLVCDFLTRAEEMTFKVLSKKYGEEESLLWVSDCKRSTINYASELQKGVNDVRYAVEWKTTSVGVEVNPRLEFDHNGNWYKVR